jgi:hypothetical protein
MTPQWPLHGGRSLLRYRPRQAISTAVAVRLSMKWRTVAHAGTVARMPLCGLNRAGIGGVGTSAGGRS